MHFVVVSGPDGDVNDHELPCELSKVSHIVVPESQFPATIHFPAAEFRRISLQLHELGKSFEVRVRTERVDFCMVDRFSCPVASLEPRCSDDVKVRVALDVHKPVTVNFATHFLPHFAEAASVSDSVELCVGADAPLLVRFELASNVGSSLKFFLAPLAL